MLYCLRIKIAACVAVSLIVAVTASAGIHVEDKHDLGTNRQGNTGNSQAEAVSRDGHIVAGSMSVMLPGEYEPFSHAALWIFSDDWSDTSDKKDLGTLNNVKGRSVIKDLSDDGHIAAGNSQYKTGSDKTHDYHAAIWTSEDNWQTWRKLDLGTLIKDSRGGYTNQGESRAEALSGDGTIAGGYADAYSPSGESSMYTHAAIWTSEDNWQTLEKHDLGTLNGKKDADSRVFALSRDGKTAGGDSYYGTTSHYHAAIWTSEDNWQTWSKQDLGTLKGDNSGDSHVSALSDDARVAGGSSSYNDDTTQVHAAIWLRSGDTYARGIDLGTLKSNNSGSSSVAAVSADGKIAGGKSSYGRSSYHAVIWQSSDNWKTFSKQDLGTLRDDNSGDSDLNGLSADGTVAVGQAVNDKGERRAVLWRLRFDGRNPQAVDRDNTTASVRQLASDSFNFMDQQRLALGRLQDGCAITRGRLCTSFAGIGSGVGGVSLNLSAKAIGVSDLYSYAQAGFGVAFNRHFAAGVSLSTGVGTLPPGDLKREGINPGAGVWIRWRKATQDGHWYLRSSAALSRAKIKRTRIGAKIEPGQGTSTSDAWGVASEFGRVHDYDFSHKIRVRYYGGLRQNDVELSGYTETRAPDFPFSWTGVTSSQTDVYIGVRYRMAFGKAFSGGIQAELEHDLLHKDPIATAYAKGFGNLVCDSDVAHTRAALSANLSYAVSDAVVVSFNPFVQDSVTDQTFYGAMLRISGAF